LAGQAESFAVGLNAASRRGSVCGMDTDGVRGPGRSEAAGPSSSCCCPHWAFPAVSLLSSAWVFCLPVAHANAIVVVLDFENAVSFGSWCFGPCKLQDVVRKACLDKLLRAVSCFTYSIFSYVVYNS